MHAPTGRNAAALVIGTILVIVGILLFVAQVTEVDVFGLLWPLLVILPGVVLLAAALSGTGAIAALIFPGAVLTSVGLIVLYQSLTGHWESWAYAWALVVPTSIGIAMMIYGVREGKIRTGRRGVMTAGIGLVLFLVLLVLFEFVLNISGRFSGEAAGIAGGALLVVAGLIVLGLSALRPRRRAR
ncbi:hypothetical protein [Sphaerobacter sp.]|uniref:hypothetical protein n=1 Tax=Sphaerobacter sp. TaxID=2099654 RepID=UPI001D59BC14|nr:hypothetical protein [Sphaerobacter sp.]MBX5446483.1 hypothetical protein [Sphaerobacter sp.]